MLSMRPLALLLSVLVLLQSACRPAQACFIPGERVPISRVVDKLEARAKAKPNDPEAYYALARVCYLAAVMNAEYFEEFADEDGSQYSLPPLLAKSPEGKILWDEPIGAGGIADGIPKPPLPKVPPPRLRSRFNYYAVLAVQNFEEAIAKAPNNALYWLGYACILEEIWSRAFGKDAALFPPEFQKVRVPSVREAYGKALTLGSELDKDTRWISPQGHVSLEAAKALVRLEPASRVSSDEEKALKEARATIARFATFRETPPVVTPVVFTLARNIGELDTLLSPTTVVTYNLRGYAGLERWPWVKPTLGFLVWDPAGEGNIRSGRQLFGGYTFQLFWKTGYEALAVLDDNDDGQLAGSELEGVRAWFDRNSNAVSDPGEVESLPALGIRAVTTQPSGFDGIHPVSRHGITLKDGTTLPTWDWMVTPISSSPQN